jgi:hypothetical protein
MSTKFNVNWINTCFLCECPLDIRILPDDPSDLFMRRLTNFIQLMPINFLMNTQIYKFFGLKARKICYGCYMSEPHKNPLCKIRNREIGVGRFRIKTISQSTWSLYSWFESFNRYLNRPDADDYVVPASV